MYMHVFIKSLQGFCMYIYIYIYMMYAHMHVCICTYLYSHSHGFISTPSWCEHRIKQQHIHACMHACMYACVHVCMPVCMHVCICIYMYKVALIRFVKADCIWVGRRRSRPKGNPRFEPFENCVFGVAQTWLHGISPSPREFCGQLKRNQL
jgi:hypothetical protein